MKKYLLPALLAALLSACGGGGSDNGGSGNGGSGAPSPVAVDSFITLVMNQFMGSSDDPVLMIDSVQPTAPENTEPVAI